MSVSMKPGATVDTAIPSPPSATASDWPSALSPALRRPVRRLLRLAPERAAGGDVDDPAGVRAAQERQRAERHVRGAEQVDLDRAPPGRLPLLVGHLADRVRLDRRGVVDQHVDARQPGRGGRRRTRRRRRGRRGRPAPPRARRRRAGRRSPPRAPAESRWCTATRSPAAAKATATARPTPREAPVTSTARPATGRPYRSAVGVLRARVRPRADLLGEGVHRVLQHAAQVGVLLHEPGQRPARAARPCPARPAPARRSPARRRSRWSGSSARR